MKSDMDVLEITLACAISETLWEYRRDGEGNGNSDARRLASAIRSMIECSSYMPKKAKAESPAPDSQPCPQTCAGCRFYDAGECHALPPVVIGVNTGAPEYDNAEFGWPIASSQGWCGSWTPKPEAKA